MKLLVVADLHGDEVMLERLKAVSSKGFDAVLIAGDITDNSTSYTADLLEAFPSAYIIPGNNENASVLEILRMAKNYSHEKRHELKSGYNIVGFGLSNPTPFHTPGEVKDEKIYEAVSKLKIDGKTILLLHAPPFGLLDEINGIHVGSQSLLRIIEEKQPALVFCGHLHEVIGVQKLGSTIIVNVPATESGMYCVAETKSNGSVGIQFCRL
jgi:uncharacterized protein